MKGGVDVREKVETKLELVKRRMNRLAVQYSQAQAEVRLLEGLLVEADAGDEDEGETEDEEAE